MELDSEIRGKQVMTPGLRVILSVRLFALRLFNYLKFVMTGTIRSTNFIYVPCILSTNVRKLYCLSGSWDFHVYRGMLRREVNH
jgi:hypothetical protein